ncbi:hypothetical protein LSH36_1526g00015 [Paralvinella palmiformis]|uniref:Uncharacterized protein n=1 Tax=Paralvinella palmiformis TaxID=53620 RepID=A0AAD9MR49_9ANNE|nr:hypothetical protein LSH36_1526g00015 [Paralvinella palmiformis]
MTSTTSTIITLLLMSLTMTRGHSRVLCLNKCLHIYGACAKQCDESRELIDPEVAAIFDGCESCRVDLAECRRNCPNWTIYDYEYEQKMRPE